MHEEVFEIESGTPEPGRVVEEVEREARRSSIRVGYQAEIKRIRAKAVAQQIGFGGRHGFRLTLIDSEGADKPQNQGNIGCGCGADRNRHAFILGRVTLATTNPASDFYSGREPEPGFHRAHPLEVQNHRCSHSVLCRVAGCI